MKHALKTFILIISLRFANKKVLKVAQQDWQKSVEIIIRINRMCVFTPVCLAVYISKTLKQKGFSFLEKHCICSRWKYRNKDIFQKSVYSTPPPPPNDATTNTVKVYYCRKAALTEQSF